MPQARLQPSAPKIMVLTSARPPVTTLSVPVMVSTMISPNKISEIRSIGSTRRLRRFLCVFAILSNAAFHLDHRDLEEAIVSNYTSTVIEVK